MLSVFFFCLGLGRHVPLKLFYPLLFFSMIRRTSGLDLPLTCFWKVTSPDLSNTLRTSCYTACGMCNHSWSLCSVRHYLLKYPKLVKQGSERYGILKTFPSGWLESAAPLSTPQCCSGFVPYTKSAACSYLFLNMFSCWISFAQRSNTSGVRTLEFFRLMVRGRLSLFSLARLWLLPLLELLVLLT